MWLVALRLFETAVRWQWCCGGCALLPGRLYGCLRERRAGSGAVAGAPGRVMSRMAVAGGIRHMQRTRDKLDRWRLVLCMQERDTIARERGAPFPKCHFFNSFFLNKLFKVGWGGAWAVGLRFLGHSGCGCGCGGVWVAVRGAPPPCLVELRHGMVCQCARACATDAGGGGVGCGGRP